MQQFRYDIGLLFQILPGNNKWRNGCICPGCFDDLPFQHCVRVDDFGFCETGNQDNSTSV